MIFTVWVVTHSHKPIGEHIYKLYGMDQVDILNPNPSGLPYCQPLRKITKSQSQQSSIIWTTIENFKVMSKVVIL
jgi:hypothetical protein